MAFVFFFKQIIVMTYRVSLVLLLDLLDSLFGNHVEELEY